MIFLEVEPTGDLPSFCLPFGRNAGFPNFRVVSGGSGRFAGFTHGAWVERTTGDTSIMGRFGGFNVSTLMRGGARCNGDDEDVSAPLEAGILVFWSLIGPTCDVEIRVVVLSVVGLSDAVTRSLVGG